jgi:hypothetical protein
VLPWLLACAGPDPSASGGPFVPRPVPDLVLGQRLTSTLAGPASATCTSPDDPAEVHHVASPDTRARELVVYGLLADTAYTCEILAAGRTWPVAFRTEPLPDFLPSWELVAADSGWGGYTLLNHGTDDRTDRQAKILLVDRDGALRWYHQVPFNAPDLDVSWLGDGQVLYGGGYAAPPTIVDLAGAVVARAAEVDVYHHHVERLPDARFLTLTLDPNTAGDVSWTGMEVEILEPDLASTSWAWPTQRGVDEGWLPVQASPGDPYHVNSVARIDEALYVNFRNLSTLAKLDADTGDLAWLLGPTGDFALLNTDGTPADPADWFYGAHAPEHHGTRILLHDNGFLRPGELQSRILALELDEAALTARILWSYEEPGWYEPIWGDVDELPDGHVLFTRAHCGTCRPSDPSTTAIVEIDPTTLEVVWRLQFADVHDAGYRAERLDGCSVFANERFCPELDSEGEAR